MCRRVLDANWREGTRDGIPYAYTAPSPGRYPWQVYWDSCFAAIARRRFDPSRARRELESLLAAADGNGFIGHTISWAQPVDHGDGGGRPGVVPLTTACPNSPTVVLSERF